MGLKPVLSNAQDGCLGHSGTVCKISNPTFCSLCAYSPIIVKLNKNETFMNQIHKLTTQHQRSKGKPFKMVSKMFLSGWNPWPRYIMANLVAFQSLLQKKR